MAVGLELRRFAPHAKVIMNARKRPDDNRQHMKKSDTFARSRCTKPHAAYDSREFAVLYDAGYDTVRDTTYVYETRNQHNYNASPTVLCTNQDLSVDTNDYTYEEFNQQAQALLLIHKDGMNGHTTLPELIVVPNIYDDVGDHSPVFYLSLIHI